MGTPRTLKKNDLIIERLSQSPYQAGDLVLTYRPTNDADADIILTEVTGGGGSGTVESVNGVGPDGAGNVALTADLVPEGVVNKYFDEAPTDGNLYARQNAGWSQIDNAASGGIAIGGAGTLAERSAFDAEPEGFVYFQTDFGQGQSVNDVYARYTATNGQTQFTLPFTATDGARTVLVTRNNVLQGPTNVYSVSGSTLTFTTALEAGDEVTALDLSSVLYGVGAIYIKESNANADWSNAIPFIGSGGGTGAVESVFGRTGVVAAQAGDYSSNQISAPATSTNYTPVTATVLGHLQGINSALPTAGPISSDAPADGNQYARKDNAWEIVAGGTGAVDSVNGQTGTVSLLSDDVPEGSTNLYFPEAPQDGNQYARQNGSWSQVTSGGVVQSITAGSGITVNSSNPANPVISTDPAIGSGTVSDITGGSTAGFKVWTGAAVRSAILTLSSGTQTAAFRFNGSTEVATPVVSTWSFLDSIFKVNPGVYRLSFASGADRDLSVVNVNAASGSNAVTVADVSTSIIEIRTNSGTDANLMVSVHYRG